MKAADSAVLTGVVFGTGRGNKCKLKDNITKNKQVIKNSLGNECNAKNWFISSFKCCLDLRAVSLMPKLSYSISSAKRRDLYSLSKNIKMLHSSKIVIKNMRKCIADCVLLTKHSRDWLFFSFCLKPLF